MEIHPDVSVRDIFGKPSMQKVNKWTWPIVTDGTFGTDVELTYSVTFTSFIPHFLLVKRMLVVYKHIA